LVVGWFGCLYLLGHWSFLALCVMHCLFPGVGLLFHGIPTNRLAAGGPWGHWAGCPSAVVVSIGAWYLTAGLALILLPGVRAFFTHQREQAVAARKSTTSE
jgi:hypothetical protein